MIKRFFLNKITSSQYPALFIIILIHLKDSHDKTDY